ncbi:uncharacterized protein si:ch73-248e21.5 isoform X1 [Electrophorus electricus]|uniref:uncharacterized protein si:ch73-248e21.5 isoform X1 n=1 Tax=Electrophorus electricus TaxID=8005 RepID=UPI0015D08BCD|nr:uncharacterized protein si:ch73-248e21.5 isoform X1 [Electrophorus electricus]
MTSAEKVHITKMSAVHPTVGVTQVLTFCAVLLTRHCMTSATAEPDTTAPTRDRADRTATGTHAAELSHVPGGDDEPRTRPRNIESLPQVTVSSNLTLLTTQNGNSPETGTWSGTSSTGHQTHGFPRQHMAQTGHESGIDHWETRTGTEPSTSKTQQHVQPSSQASWGRTEGTARPGVRLGGFTAGHKDDGLPTPDWGFVKRMAGMKPWESAAVTARSASHETGAVIRTTSWRPQMQTSVGRESHDGMMETGATKVPLENSTEDSGVTWRIKGSHSLTMEKQDPLNTTLSHDTAPTQPHKQSASQATPGNVTSMDGSADLSSEVTTRYNSTAQALVNTAQHEVPFSKGLLPTENVEETFTSSTSTNTISATFPEVRTDREGEGFTTGSVTMTPRNMVHTATTTGPSRTQATYMHGRSLSVWRTSAVNASTDATEVAKNVSTGANNTRLEERETGFWPDCHTKGWPSESRRSSKLVCLLTLWSLAVIASVFLGLTIFLCARLSVVKQRAGWRGRGRGQKRNSTAKETQSLWAEPGASAQERVELWYANGTTLQVEVNGRERGREERTRRKSEKRKARDNEGDMWAPPRVTMDDITEFWYGNRRARNTERPAGQGQLMGMHQYSQE